MSKHRIEDKGRRVWVKYENCEYKVLISENVDCVAALLDEFSEKFEFNQTMYSLQGANRVLLNPRTEVSEFDLEKEVFHLVKKETENEQLATSNIPNKEPPTPTPPSNKIQLHPPVPPYPIKTIKTFPPYPPHISCPPVQTIPSNNSQHHPPVTSYPITYHYPLQAIPSNNSQHPPPVTSYPITYNYPLQAIPPNNSQHHPPVTPYPITIIKPMSLQIPPQHDALGNGKLLACTEPMDVEKNQLMDSVDTSLVSEQTDEQSDDEEEDKREDSLDKSSEREMEKGPYKNLINVLIPTVKLSHEITGVRWFTTVRLTENTEETSLLAISWNLFEKYYASVQNIIEISTPELISLFEFDPNDEKCDGKGWLEVDRDYLKIIGFLSHQFDALYTYKPWWSKIGLPPPPRKD